MPQAAADIIFESMSKKASAAAVADTDGDAVEETAASGEDAENGVTKVNENRGWVPSGSTFRDFLFFCGPGYVI